MSENNIVINGAGLVVNVGSVCIGVACGKKIYDYVEDATGDSKAAATIAIASGVGIMQASKIVGIGVSAMTLAALGFES